MRLKDVPYGKRFRLLVDLEPGETVDDLPIFVVPYVDASIKRGLAIAKDVPQGIYLVVVIQGSQPTVTIMRYDTDVEVVS